MAFRIVSTIASATEIVCALGFQSSLVGRSHECDFPAGIENLPVCTEPKIDVEGSSYAIDERIKAILQEALSVYRVDAEKLRSLQPTLIVTQTQCEVCAVSFKDVEQATCQWLDSRPQILSLSAEDLNGLWSDIQSVATALDAREKGQDLTSSLQGRMQAIEQQASLLPSHPTVACIEWLDPLMASGNWMPELVTMAGGINLFGEAGQHAPWMKWEDLLAKDPEVILLLPCGFNIERTRKEMASMTQKAEWAGLRAVKQGQVYLTDGNQFFNRPGPRLVESLEIIAEILHPSHFCFGHQGTGWMQWNDL